MRLRGKDIIAGLSWNQNPFLMADLYGNLPDGTSLDCAIKADYKGEHQE